MRIVRKPVVLHVNTEKGFRGGEIQTLEIAKGLQSRGFPSVLLAHGGGELIQRARKEGLTCVEFVPRGELDIFAAFRLKRVVKEYGAELVHCHTSHALGIAYLSGVRKQKVAVVGTRRVSFPLRSGMSAKKYLAASKIIAVSESVGKDLYEAGIPADKITVIHSGIDLSKFETLLDPAKAKERLGVGKSFPVIGVIGALAAHKGHRTFLRAVEKAWVRFPDTVAVIVGDGPNLQNMKKSCQSRAIPSFFLGEVANVVPIYRCFDIFVLPSVSGEGSPAVIKEAAASEIPVIATNVGGVGEIFENNKEALLVPPSDSDRMTEAIIRLASDKQLRYSLVKAAKKKVAAFGFDAVVDAHERVYAELLGSRPRV